MKIKDGFSVKSFAGENLLVATGNNRESFKDTIILNDSALFIFNTLINGATFEEIVQKILSEYEVEKEVAISDVSKVIEIFNKHNIIEDN